MASTRLCELLLGLDLTVLQELPGVVIVVLVPEWVGLLLQRRGFGDAKVELGSENGQLLFMQPVEARRVVERLLKLSDRPVAPPPGGPRRPAST